MLSACGPVQCDQLEVQFKPLEYKPAPAGRVVILCDGRELTSIVGRNVR